MHNYVQRLCMDCLKQVHTRLHVPSRLMHNFLHGYNRPTYTQLCQTCNTALSTLKNQCFTLSFWYLSPQSPGLITITTK